MYVCVIYGRKDHHSFGSSVVSFSATSHLVASGFSSLIFLDELYLLTKIIFGVFYVILPSVKDGSNGRLNNEEESSGETVYFESENGETFLNRNKQALLVTNQFIVNSTCEIRSFDIVLHNSRKMFSQENYMNMMSIDREIGGKSAMHDSSGNGIYISVQQLIVELIFRGGNIDVVFDTAGVRSTIFRYLTESEGCFDKSELKKLLCSLNLLTEASVSHAKLCLCLRTFEKALRSASVHYTADASSLHGKTLNMIGESSSVMNTERLGDHCLITNIICSGIYMGGCQIKDILINDKRFEELNVSFSAGREFQKVCCQSKGGFVLLEATAAVMFVECITSYYHWILELWPTGQSSRKVEVAQNSREMAALDGHSNPNLQKARQELLWDHLKLFSMSLLHLSLVLVERDESGRVQELLFEVDFHSNLELLNIVRKISMSSNFSVRSQFMHGAKKHKTMVIQNPPLSSVVHAASSSSFVSDILSPPLQHKDRIPGQKDFYISPLNYILKDMQCCLEVEEPVTRAQINPACSNSIWVGNGSISGLDMTLSLSEIKMVLSAFGSVSEVLSREETYKEESRNWSYNQELDGSTHEMVTDGTIVAIQDVDQHMYIAVEGGEGRYDIAGSIHYSLVGECALFRVKYHNPRWKSHVQYFSLISLYAKDGSGESLRLNCLPRSRFVDISCSNDGGPALWSMLPYKPDAYEDATELESSCSPSKRMFHLVNKKNDCAVAFIDGTLEFVSKPGNLFKWKVFNDPGPTTNNLFAARDLVEGTSIRTTGSNEFLALPRTGINPQSDSNVSDSGELRTNGNLLGITITVDKVTLTIVHELSDTEEKFPLLQGTIIPNQAIIQISDSKVRFMNTLEVTICYFDALQNSWMEFIQPLEICTFYCFKFQIECPENSLHRGHSHLFARIKEVTILVSELSLDTILFVIGKLDLAGPYAVKSSMVLANCCKVENQSGLTLLCQFYNQDASVSARQSTTILLRHLALENRPPEASFFSVKLVQQDFLSTFPIHLSLKEARQFAWRTRIVSSQDSKSFPGPFLVIEISRGNEDGLSIGVSPLLRICNETDFSLELRFQRPHHKEEEYALLTLKAGDVIDDSMAAFSAIDLSGGSRKALTSLSVGNFVFSFRPNITDGSKNLKISSVEWSDDLKGGKPVPLSGIFDKLSYQVRKALSVDSGKVSLSSANCALKSEDGIATHIYFLIQTVGKGIPVISPDKFGYAHGNRNAPVAMQEQKEVFVLPTVQVSNLLHTDIQVNLTETDPKNTIDHENPWSCATIPSGSAVNFYANPATIFFVVTLTSFGSSCLPVNSSDWMRKLQKQKGNIHHFDIELVFGGGKYLAMLRLSRGHRGTLKAVIFTPYALQNDTNNTLFCFAANQKPLPRSVIERSSPGITPDMGSYLPPNSITSWFLKCHKLHFKLLEEKALGAQLDLDALSGLTEIDLEADGTFGSKNITRLGVSLRPLTTKAVSSQIVSLSPRYVVFNESEGEISIRQCYIEDTEELIAIKSKQRIALRLKTVIRNRKETNVIENLLKKHTKSQDELSLFIQFKPNETELGWSGPICVASLGLFFLKFRKSLEFPQGQSYRSSDKNDLGEFAAVHVVEEGPTVVLHFYRPPLTNVPYRIENSLRNAPITYYQKGSSEPETLGAGVTVNYVWDDLTLPHKLVIQLDDVHLLREISLDKVRAWKPFYRNKQTRGLGFRLPLEKKPEDQKQTTYSRLVGTETVKVGYEVYAEGVTRVLRICEFSDSQKINIVRASSTKMRLRISYLAVHLLEHAKQEIDSNEASDYVPIIITRLERFNWDSVFIDEHKYNQIRVRSLSVDEKWDGAPFAAMLRRHQSEKSDTNDYILHVAVVLLPTRSGVKQVKYLSIVLQPLDLNLDEETLMKIVSFWRSSLSESTSPRQQYYFDHFEIHPVKIVASFLPGDSNYSYSSTQETLRSLLHSVIQVPTIKSKTVELNGVLVTHALITIRDLTIKCAQHYSWYAMRAIYIAKGSPLLPPAFASLFDDLASSSLDVFFDPSSGLVNLPGVTLGTLKLISKFIDNKGFSGTKRYFGDLGKTLKTAGSNILFAAVTEVSDSVLKGAETSGVNGMVNGFHQGVLKLAMEPSVLGSAFMEGGPDRKIKLDRSPGVDELYIEGYLQAMLDTMYKQEYLRVRVIENQVILKNLPPSSSLIEEIVERVKDFLASKSLLKGGSSTSHSLRHIRGEREWRIGPTVLTLCEHLFVSFAIQILRKQAGKAIAKGRIKWKGQEKGDEDKEAIASGDEQKVWLVWRWGIGKFLFSGIVAYVDGRLCRNIPHPLARRIVSGFLLSFLDNKSDDQTK
ncbi:hypothetical protein ACJIZ3_008133 [Penstemon smallii]|uniref:Vacuolar protein sorting-associated protein 13 VPS13 adaptor binding domain-containing protein n=1 Tax=Penstemon smallii TaxID=265156 RepID=A0ABD3T997_9LAMI